MRVFSILDTGSSNIFPVFLQCKRMSFVIYLLTEIYGFNSKDLIVFLEWWVFNIRSHKRKPLLPKFKFTMQLGMLLFFFVFYFLWFITFWSLFNGFILIKRTFRQSKNIFLWATLNHLKLFTSWFSIIKRKTPLLTRSDHSIWIGALYFYLCFWR